MPESNLEWLAAAFAIAWLLIGLYLVRLWRGQRALERKLDDLRRPPSDETP